MCFIETGSQHFQLTWSKIENNIIYTCSCVFHFFSFVIYEYELTCMSDMGKFCEILNSSD